MSSLLATNSGNPLKKVTFRVNNPDEKPFSLVVLNENKQLFEGFSSNCEQMLEKSQIKVLNSFKLGQIDYSQQKVVSADQNQVFYYDSLHVLPK